MKVECELRVWETVDSTPASLKSHDPVKAIRIAGSLARTGEYARVLLTEERKGITGRVAVSRFSFERGKGLNPGEYVPTLFKGDP